MTMEELRLVPLSEYHADCQILEVEAGASSEELRQAYRDQTKVWHPDRFSNDLRLQKKAEEKIKQINLAYRRLCGLCPYEQPVITPLVPGPAFGNSMPRVSNGPGFLLKKVSSLAHGLFHLCWREKRSLAIAISAFLLGLGLGVWLLPQDSEPSNTAKGPRQIMLEEKETAKAADTEPLLTLPLDSTSSIPAVSRPGINHFASEQNMLGATALRRTDERAAGKAPTHNETSWEKHWPKTFGAGEGPEPAARDNYRPISFMPHQSTSYYALRYDEGEQGQFTFAPQHLILWPSRIHATPRESIPQQQSHDGAVKTPSHEAGAEASQATTPDESVTPAFPTTRDKEAAERNRRDNHAAAKPAHGHPAPNENVIPAFPAKAIPLYAPRPSYPEEARSRHIAGTGVCVVSIDPATGMVTSASMAQSTGSVLLDKSAIRTLRTWKFKPGKVSQVSIPVEFTTEAQNP